MQDLPERIEHTPRPGSVSYYCLVFTPARHRPASVALYALCREMDLARDASDPGIARLKLQWWREELLRAAGNAARHPITQELVAANLRGVDALTALVDHHERELAHQDFVAEAEFDAWAEQGPGTVLRAWANLLGGQREGAWQESAHALAMALQRLDALNRTPVMARRGTTLHPAERLAHFGVDATQLADATPNPKARQLIAAQRRLADAELERVLTDWPRSCRGCHAPLLVLAELRHRTLHEQLKSHPERIDKRVVLTPLRKLWHGWRRARRER